MMALQVIEGYARLGRWEILDIDAVFGSKLEFLLLRAGGFIDGDGFRWRRLTRLRVIIHGTRRLRLVAHLVATAAESGDNRAARALRLDAKDRSDIGGFLALVSQLKGLLEKFRRPIRRHVNSPYAGCGRKQTAPAHFSEGTDTTKATIPHYRLRGRTSPAEGRGMMHRAKPGRSGDYTALALGRRTQCKTGTGASWNSQSGNGLAPVNAAVRLWQPPAKTLRTSLR